MKMVQILQYFSSGLTQNLKKSILVNEETMRLRIIYFILLLSLLGGITACSRPQPKTQLQFGILAAEKDLWDEAIFRWKKVLQFTPDSAAAHNNLAVAYEKKGVFEKAEKEYKEALRLRPNDKFIKSNYEKFKDRSEENKKSEKDADKKK
jgi:Tfp pilus assembly protein PilF